MAWHGMAWRLGVGCYHIWCMLMALLCTEECEHGLPLFNKWAMNPERNASDKSPGL